MNLACDLGKDKHWNDDDYFQLSRILGAWDMNKFDASMWLKHVREFAEAEAQHQIVSRHEAVILKKLKQGDVKEVISILESPIDSTEHSEKLFLVLRDYFSEIGLPIAAGVAQIEADKIKSRKSVKDKEYLSLVNQLMDAFQSELEGKSLFIIKNNDRRSFYEKKDTILGKNVIEKLADSDLREDAAEAGNCYALGRYTACVFHLMRVMERLVRKLAKKRKTKFNPQRDTWQKILKRIKISVDTMSERTQLQIKRKAQYQEICLDLTAIKDAWRNPTMHPRAKYLEADAKKIIEKVQDFAEDFAKLL